MKSLKQLIIDTVAKNPRKYNLRILPAELREQIMTQHIKGLQSDYIEKSSYAIFCFIDYTWFLHYGWLNKYWRLISFKQLKYHQDCQQFFEGILIENEIYYFYPSLHSNLIIIKQIGDLVYINQMFPNRSEFDHNPYIDKKNDVYGLSIYKDTFRLSKNPYI